MFTFILSFFSLFRLFSTITITNSIITAHPYKATDHFVLNCGSASSTFFDGRKWEGEGASNFVTSNITTTSFSSTSSINPRWDGNQVSKFVSKNTTNSFSSTPYRLDPSVPKIPYSTAIIFNSSFTYNTFPVTPGPKFLRLFFYPATYSGLNADQFFFSVSSNGVSLLTNFSAFLTASYLAKTRADAGIDGPSVPHFVKEFMIYVKDIQILNVTFTPSPNSYAFINGIEIVSMPEDLYFKRKDLKYVAQTSGPLIDEEKALENVYRLNMGGADIYVNGDTGMYRSWDHDHRYIFPPSANGLEPLNKTPITYTTETPTYTAPEPVYQTQRSMGKLADLYNLTWMLPVDSGFYYMLRLHFCNIIPQYTRKGQTVFKIFINNQTAEEEADLFNWTPGTGYPVVKDYVVFVKDHPDGHKSKQDLWLALHPNSDSDEYRDGFLNGLEAFKLSTGGSLASPNPELSSTTPPARPIFFEKKTPFATIIGCVIAGVAFVFVLLVSFSIMLKHGKAKRVVGENPQSNAVPSCSLCSFTSVNIDFAIDQPSPIRYLNLNLRLPFTDIFQATDGFNESLVIGKGSFGKVYKGTLSDGMIVAVKRGERGQGQGQPEFVTEIMVLSKIRHCHLVNLIAYCDERSEIILVYEFMQNGSLQDHLYGNKDHPKLSWIQRLEICISATRGLHYLHTGSDAGIIHRDVKSTNILINENYVAKLSDFGISRLENMDESEIPCIKGSFGYLDPEYIRCMKLTKKSDVYSFGVVLLEVLCARPALDNTRPHKESNLADWAIREIKNGKVDTIIDPFLSGTINPNSLSKFLEMTMRCLKETGNERPSMIDVLWDLEYALKLQQMVVDKEPFQGSTMNTSLQLPISLIHRLPSHVSDNSEVNGSSTSSYPSETQVSSKFNIKEAQ